MFFKRKLTTRPASLHDSKTVVSLSRYERYVHAHLDWQPPEGWLGRQPFRLAALGRRVVAALACPPDPPDTAWLRLFAVAERFPLKRAWETLWSEVGAELEKQAVPLAAALSPDNWLPPLLEAAGFGWTHDVVGLCRPAAPLPPRPEVGAALRPARPVDLQALARLDTLAFQRPWRHSRDALKLALAQATNASVAEAPGGQLVGYQISTTAHKSGHLARLAVHPAWRGAGLGTALTLDALQHFSRLGANSVTVNTQADNAASLALYRELGFTFTGDRLLVFQLQLAEPQR